MFDSETSWSRLDLTLLQNGFVHLYWRPAVLAEDIRALDDLGYEIIQLDASSWTSEDDMHRDLADSLHFPAYYGRNLNALSDCLGDVAHGDYGWNPASAGLVLAFRGFDAFANVDLEVAHASLDIIADRARFAALFGNRLLCLVQSDDPELTMEPVGAQPVMWNPAEWLHETRRPDQDR